MKEADLPRRFHRPRGWTAAGTGGPHPQLPLPSMPSSLSLVPRKTSQQRPPTRRGAGMWARPTRPTGGGMQSLFQPINIPGLGGAKNSPRGRAAVPGFPPARSPRRRPCRGSSTGGTGRRLLRPHGPSPAADTRGPPVRGNPCAPRVPPPGAREGPDPARTHSRPSCPALFPTPNSASGATRPVRERSSTHLQEENTPAQRVVRSPPPPTP